MQAASLLISRLSIAIGYACAPLYFVSLLVAVREVIMRYFFNAPSDWAFEVTLTLCAVAWALSVGYVGQQNRHIAITFLHDLAGPALRRVLDVVTLVPMFPHTLSSRPIVIDAASEIRIHIGETNQTYPHISCDGQTRAVAKPDDVLVITRKPERVQLVHPIGHNFYDVLRSKLGWSHRLGD